MTELEVLIPAYNEERRLADAIDAWARPLRRRSGDGVIDSQNGIPFPTPLVLRGSTPIVQLIHHVRQDQFAAHFPKPTARFGQFLENQASRGRRSEV